MSIHTFDLIAIGTGSAASAVAFRCRAAGWSVAIIDSRPFGGTCALRGCDPKKVLVGAADVVDWIHRMDGKGIHSDGARIDWPALMRFKRSFTDPVPPHRDAALRKAGIETFHGRARFVRPTTVQVGSDRLQGRHVLIATGAKPVDLGLPGRSFSRSAISSWRSIACPVKSCSSEAGTFPSSLPTSPPAPACAPRFSIAAHGRWAASIRTS